MATYFHGSSEIQADGLQTLYLMNPNYLGYSDTQNNQPASNMLFLSSAAGNAPCSSSISHAQPPPQSHHFVGVPLPTTGSGKSEDPNCPSQIPTLHGVIPRFPYNLWGNIDPAAAGNHQSGGPDVSNFHRPVVSPTTQQGLSLSLSSQQPGYGSLAGKHGVSGQAPVAVISPASGDNVHGSGGSSSSVSTGISGMQSLILGSKYLKAAQLLLDEVVNVGKPIKADAREGTREKTKMNGESTAGGGDCSSGGGETSSRRGIELSTAQRQDLQMKKAKLVTMLDEVERRYRQYHQQMQIVVSSFEQAAGIGAAKSYTALALQTISKQFRCLKDAIAGQIKATSKSLGEDDNLAAKSEGSRLKFVDHQLRQQRALQQLGMIQHNAWRPQRGLPERAVSVLRAWLFEHFLHPYPKDSDKQLLAKQTGLTRSQVSNWFINARVRLWKPMVEEMYVEEMKDHEDQNGSENNTSNKKGPAGLKSTAPQENTSFQMDQSMHERPTNLQAANSPTEISNSTASTSPLGGSHQPQGAFTLIGSSEMEGIVQRSPKKPRSSDLQSSPSSILSMDMEMKHGETITKRFNEKSYSLLPGTASHGSAFGAYPMGDIGRFNPEHLATRFHGNSVSLTLGLPHCENLSLSGTQSFLSNQSIHLGTRIDMAGPVEAHHYGSLSGGTQPSHSNSGYESINIENRKRFAAQLLPDFVA
ncbi:BEL1-like homeodomain protein 1 [Diospyros lotus]|uniref:BEL1-like homeodomain protein 1 n=1 Tax=Diospyros lotus TaxID=55363 RepID=UPI002251627F|nr:BEL1-like homeodomain protein 1 [Diospyros lotus]XP_052211664.1 BEL1-like homeodomain protein 1 [Diospyros lotus]XP_052211673.1 BEL1-like homeodomain protein 1 [Diospyros lotus]